MTGGDQLKRIYVAGAGTGKTRMLREVALERYGEQRVLYLTYTDANAAEFRASIVGLLGYLPSRIKVMTWFSFLLTHGVRPFPARGFHRIDRMLFNNQEPRNAKGITRGHERYYCPDAGVVYRTRLSDLAVWCNREWDGEVVRRVCDIYGTILVDEAQDFAGYDYDLLLSLMNQSRDMVIVGDPRQQTYRTGANAKNRSYSNVFDYFADKTCYIVDDTTLSVTHRCSADVIALANKLYSEYPPVQPSSKRLPNPEGKVSKIEKTKFREWFASHDRDLTALVWDARTKVPAGCRAMNMGESKGLTLEDVAIIPTTEMKKWFEGKPSDLEGITKAKLYVAITRASGNLFFVV